MKGRKHVSVGELCGISGVLLCFEVLKSLLTPFLFHWYNFCLSHPPRHAVCLACKSRPLPAPKNITVQEWEMTDSRRTWLEGNRQPGMKEDLSKGLRTLHTEEKRRELCFKKIVRRGGKVYYKQIMESFIVN